MKRAVLLLIVASLLMLPLVACQEQSGAVETPAVVETTSTPEPTPTAAATATVEPEPTETTGGDTAVRPPRVAARTPTFRILDTRRPTIKLAFNQAMDRASVAASLSVVPEADLRLSWDHEKILTIETAEALAPGTTYEFRLDRTAVNVQGTPLGDDYDWRYQTRDLISRVTWPQENHRQIPIAIHFNYAMDVDSVRQSFRIEPDLTGYLTWNGKKTVATFTPAVLLSPSTEYEVSFDEPLVEANGDVLPFPEPFTFTSPPPILTAVPRGENANPRTTIEVTFDRPMDETATQDAFQISPAVNGTFSWRETTLIFEPESERLAEHTNYTVTVGAEALAADGDPILDEAYQWTFQTGRLVSVASFGQGPNAQVLDVHGRRAIQFVLNADSAPNLTFELYHLTLEQFLDRYSSGFRGVAGRQDLPISTEGTELARRWTVEPSQSLHPHQNVQEVVIPEDVPAGLYVLNLEADQLDDQLILLLTGNTVVVKQAEEQIVAWVTDINGGPVPGVAVSVYARNGELISNGRADDSGVFRTQVSTDPQPLIVVARDGEDVSASGLSNEWRSSNSPWRRWWQPAPAVPDYAAHIYTDRPIYRPGQLVFFKAILRRDDDAVLSVVPQGTAATVRIRDARNNVVQTQELTTNDFGTINGQFQLAEGAMLGDYKVEVAPGNEGESHSQVFKVEDYRKPDYQVSVLTQDSTGTSADRFIESDEIAVTVDASYFFGQPVADADVTVNLFVLDERYPWDDSSDDEYVWYRSHQSAPRGRTDAAGRFTFNLEAKMGDYGRSVHWRSSLEQSIWAIEATVADGSRQVVSGFAVVRVFNAMEKVRLDTNGYLRQPGTTFTVRAEVQDIFDRPVSDRDLDLTLRRWDRTSGDYSDVVQSMALRTNDNGRASTPFTIEEPGYYQIRVSGRDRLGKPINYFGYIYAFSNRYTRWYGREDSGLNVSADKASYAPGEAARLVIESPFSGPALLTFERGTTRRQQLVELTAPATVVEVPIQPDDAPNIYVTVNAWVEQEAAINENTYFSLADSQLHTASVNLSVPVTDKKLDVTITPDKETYAPREEATFTVRVTNQAGTPVSAEVSLAMVDEAIFALSGDLSGTIFDAFYYERDNIVRTYDALALRRELWVPGMGGGGGGGVLSGRPRSDFPDTAEWFPTLHTDFNGEAKVTVTLPDSLTSWRLTAKAATADTQVGQTFTNVVVQQEIVVRPLLPRTLTDGDQVALSAVVHNYSEERQRVTVSTAEAEGEAFDGQKLAFAGPVTQTIELEPGALQVVGWPATATGSGDVDVVIQALAGDSAGDAVQMTIPVRPLAIPDVNTRVGQFRNEFETTVNVPAGALPMSSTRVELSRSIAGTLLEGLEYLTGFPYGCVEQTMSRALPNAVVGRALHQLGVSNPTLQADLPAKINASLQRLYGYQHNDGGWGWWYDDASHDYQTAWVVFGLAVTADAGYEVDEGVIERGVAWLNEHLDDMDIRTRAYALYSMAVAGQPNVEETVALVDQLDELDTFSQAGLALALHEAGASALARDVVDVLAGSAVTANGEVYWAGEAYDGAYYRKTMASATRSTALALSAFTQIRPGHELEPGIVRWLMGQRQQQGWGTTNETSYAILGLTDHLLATSFSEAATATGYTVLLNGEVIADGNLGRGEPAVSLAVPAEQMRTGSNELRITQSGGGFLYYVINNRVYLAQEEIAAAGDVQVSRQYLEADTNKRLETAVPGQLVRVRLTVVMPEEGSYVIVEDSLPGGLEALNEGLNNTSHVAAADQEPRYYWQDYGYNYKEIWADHVSFFVTEMDAGRHTYTYYARATQAGSFVAMPAQVYAMYDLATWGRSASATIVIAEVPGT